MYILNAFSQELNLIYIYHFRVREAQNTITGERVAIKLFDKEQLMRNTNLGQSIKKEISFEINKFKHSCIS